jgi:hypothetical protein
LLGLPDWAEASPNDKVTSPRDRGCSRIRPQARSIYLLAEKCYHRYFANAVHEWWSLASHLLQTGDEARLQREQTGQVVLYMFTGVETIFLKPLVALYGEDLLINI